MQNKFVNCWLRVGFLLRRCLHFYSFLHIQHCEFFFLQIIICDICFRYLWSPKSWDVLCIDIVSMCYCVLFSSWVENGNLDSFTSLFKAYQGRCIYILVSIKFKSIQLWVWNLLISYISESNDSNYGVAGSRTFWQWNPAGYFEGSIYF